MCVCVCTFPVPAGRAGVGPRPLCLSLHVELYTQVRTDLGLLSGGQRH